MPSITTLVPPLLGINGLRIDSAIHSNFQRYEDDRKWFAKHPQRRMFLRTDIDEFDPTNIPIAESLQMPRLHVLVIKIAPEVHSVQPIYRGKQFWSHQLDSDSAVATVLVEMQQRKGLDSEEFAAFLDRIAAENKAFREANRPTGKNIH